MEHYLLRLYFIKKLPASIKKSNSFSAFNKKAKIFSLEELSYT